MGKTHIEPITLKVVTPLFLGNAGLKEADDETITDIPSELRPPSLKGVLRFWHRVIGPDNLRTEAEYFGSTQGQSSFLLQVLDLPKSFQKDEEWQSPLGYLGYGPIMRVKVKRQTKKVLLSRQFIQPGTQLNLRLVFHPDASSDTRNAVLRSFRLLSLFGGLGSRNRRGFGSVVLANEKPLNETRELITQIRSAISSCDIQTGINYTGFNRGVRVVVGIVEKSWERTLKIIGEAMQKYRADFKSDTELIKGYLKTGQISSAPDRTTFGLPHNYFFKETMRSVMVSPLSDHYTRRASPLFIHIHELAGNRFAAVITFMPSRLLPEGEYLQVKETTSKTQLRFNTNIQKPCQIAAVNDWKHLSGFIDHLCEKYDALEVQ
jgi:CRISPR-associated protein Cmr1